MKASLRALGPGRRVTVAERGGPPNPSETTVRRSRRTCRFTVSIGRIDARITPIGARTSDILF
jgi:hypothetical protein